jgi:hypothetical protein
LLIDHGGWVIPDRSPRIMDVQLEWAARKAADGALTPADSCLSAVRS